MQINEKFISIMIVLLFLGLSTSSSIASNSEIVEKLSVENDYININIKNSKILCYNSEELLLSSYKYGEKMGDKYFLMYQFLNKLFSLYNKEKATKILEKVNNQKNLLNKYCEYFLEELKGLSQATHIPINRLISLQHFISQHIHGQCTITGSTHPATKNNQTYITQNWDIYSFSPLKPLTRFFTFFPRIHDDKSNYSYVFLGVPVLYEIPLLNEKGLGFGAAALSLTENESRYIDEGEGIPIYYLELMTMKFCSNITEVANLWSSVNRSSDPKLRYPRFWDYDITLWADKEGGILMIEQTTNHLLFATGNSTEITNTSPGILWHANHHQWLKPNETGSQYPWESTSGLRASRALELLEKYNGSITLKECMNITRDHGGGTDPNKEDSSDICRKGDRHCWWTTAFAWIVQPKNLTVYWTHNRPCLPIIGRFKEYNFQKKFDNQPPTTSISRQGKSGDNGWNTSDVNIKFITVDDNSGVAKTFYKKNNNKWKIYKNEITLSKNGQYKFKYYSKDKAGNIEEKKISILKIDKDPPNLELKKKKLIGRIKIIANTNDKTSGVNRVKFYLEDFLLFEDYKTPFECIIPWSDNTNGTIKAVVYDNAGNIAVNTISLIIKSNSKNI